MNRNVEIKARVNHPDQLEATLRRRCSEPAILLQRDTFFCCPAGRLKLREEAGRSELIFYARSAELEAKESRYWRCPMGDAAAAVALLTAAFGLEGVVEKRRLLFHIGQTRVHLDAVTDLGNFMELEVVLADAQTVEHGKDIATALMAELGIDPDDLIGPAYVDLIKLGQTNKA